MNHLLSAYLDGELTGRETSEVRAHLDTCPNCQHDYETLQATKRMVASLALKMPREELEGLLIREGRKHETARTQSPFSVRAMAWLLGTHPIALQESRSAALSDRSFLRARPLAATAVLSVAGLWIASAALDTSSYRGGASSDGAWVATANGPGVVYGGPQNTVPAPVLVASSGGGLGYARAAFGPQIPQILRPAFAVWMSPSRGDMGSVSPDQAVSLPIVASSGLPPAPWGRTQNGSAGVSVMNGNPTAFVPAPVSANSPLNRVSFNQYGH